MSDTLSDEQIQIKRHPLDICDRCGCYDIECGCDGAPIAIVVGPLPIRELPAG